MPGIYGIISNRSKAIVLQELSQMGEHLRHDPFYQTGVFSDESLGIYASWTCPKGSFSDCMPVLNEKGDMALVYSGEDHKDIEVLDRLKAFNHTFSKTNASYLVHMYEEYGDRFLEHLNGRCHGVLIDKRVGKAVLFNDRYGLHRLYFCEQPGTFYFSSEAKSILQVVPRTRNIDPASMAELLMLDCVPGNKSLFENVYVLPGGSSWFFRGSEKPEKTQYFNTKSFEEQTLLEKEFHYERFQYTLQQVLPRYFRSDEKIALSLTADPATRAFVASVPYGPKRLALYANGGVFSAPDDIEAADELCRGLGQSFVVLNAGEGFIDRFPDYAERSIFISDGCMGAGGAIDLCLGETAREISSAKLSCDYGSQLLKKIPLYQRNVVDRSLFSREFQEALDHVGNTHSDPSSSYLTYVLNEELPWRQYGRLAFEERLFNLKTPFLDNDIVALLYRATDDVIEGGSLIFRLIQDSCPNRVRRSLLETPRQFLSIIRRYLSFQASREYNLSSSRSSFLASCYRSSLSDYVKEILLDTRPSHNPFINQAALEPMINDHIVGKRDFGLQITALITVVLTYHIFIQNVKY